MVEIIRKSHWSTLKTSSTSYWPRPIYIWSSPFAVNSCLKIVFLLLLNNFGSFCSVWVPMTHFWCIPNKVLFSSIKENSFESLQRRQWQSSSQLYPPLDRDFPSHAAGASQANCGRWTLSPLLVLCTVHSLWSSFAHFAMTIVHTLTTAFTFYSLSVWHRNSHLKLLLYWDYKG